jgi:hypothetical protein
MQLIRAMMVMYALAATSVSPGGTPRSLSYSFDYATVGMGGGISSSADYQMVALADENGSSGPAASEAYQIEPAVGAPTGPRAAVKFWALYE